METWGRLTFTLDPFSAVDGFAPIPLMTSPIDSPATEELASNEDLQPLDVDMTQSYNHKFNIISLSLIFYIYLSYASSSHELPEEESQSRSTKFE